MKAAEFRKAIAVMMMSVMLITCMPAWADVETATVAVNAETEDLEVTVEAIRVIEVTPEMDRTVGLEVSADGHDAEAKVEKGIVAQGENNPGENTQGTAGIVMKTGGEGSEAEAEIGDEGVSVKDTRVAVGIEMNMSSGSEAEAEVSGSVEATAVSPSGESSNAVGVAVDLGQCGNSSVEVKIYGDIEATGGNTATGLEFGTAERPIENNTANVRVDGDINAKTIYDDQRSGDGALGIHAEGIAGKAAVTVNGLVNATGQNSATAVFAGTNCEEERIEVAVGGNITAVADPTAEGTTATGITATLNKGSMEMNVGGGVTAAAAGERGSAAAIRVANIVEDGKSGEVEITVEGNVQSTGKAISICGDGIYDQRERVTLEGTAEVKEEEFLRS